VACALGVVVAITLGAGGAHACYSGLVNIPTAEVLEPGQLDIAPQFDGSFAAGSTDTRILNTELGITSRFEAGVDFDLSPDAEASPFLNAKYLLLPGGEGATALALGICSVGRGLNNTPYLVATQEFRSVRGHLGVARIDDHHRWFVGADHALTDQLTLMADCTNGAENYATVGGCYQFTDGFGITAGAILPNARGEDDRFTVYFVFSGSYLPQAEQ